MKNVYIMYNNFNINTVIVFEVHKQIKLRQKSDYKES